MTYHGTSLTLPCRLGWGWCSCNFAILRFPWKCLLSIEKIKGALQVQALHLTLCGAVWILWTNRRSRKHWAMPRFLRLKRSHYLSDGHVNTRAGESRHHIGVTVRRTWLASLWYTWSQMPLFQVSSSILTIKRTIHFKFQYQTLGNVNSLRGSSCCTNCDRASPRLAESVSPGFVCKQPNVSSILWEIFL